MPNLRCHRTLLAPLALALVLLFGVDTAAAGVVSTVAGFITEYETATGDTAGVLQARAALNCLALAVALSSNDAEANTETYRTKCRAFEDQTGLIETPDEALAKGLIHLLGVILRTRLTLQ